MAYYNYYPQYPYQSYAMPQQQSYTQTPKTMEWVEGEVGAKAFQMPQGLPVNTPIPLWDSQEKKIYLKSWNQMGAANYPMQVLEYTIKEQPSPMLMEGQSAAGNYVTKEDFEQFKEELKNMMSHNATTNSRGGNNGKSAV